MSKETDDFNPHHWDEPYETWSVELPRACTTKFSFASTGYRGGDWGHGSRLLIEIEDLASTAMEVRETVCPRGGRKISILAGGDHELANMAEGFELLAKRLRAVLEEARSPSPFD